MRRFDARHRMMRVVAPAHACAAATSVHVLRFRFVRMVRRLPPPAFAFAHSVTNSGKRKRREKRLANGARAACVAPRTGFEPALPGWEPGVLGRDTNGPWRGGGD